MADRGGSAAAALPTDGSSGGTPEERGQGAQAAAGGGGGSAVMVDGVGHEESREGSPEKGQGQQVGMRVSGGEGEGLAGSADGKADEVDDSRRSELKAGAEDIEKVGATGSAEERDAKGA